MTGKWYAVRWNDLAGKPTNSWDIKDETGKSIGLDLFEGEVKGIVEEHNKAIRQVLEFGGYPKQNGPKCPKCGSRDTVAIWRDAVWEETGCRCNKCRHDFIKG